MLKIETFTGKSYLNDVSNIYCLRPQDRVDSVYIDKKWVKIRKYGFTLALR